MKLGYMHILYFFKDRREYSFIGQARRQMKIKEFHSGLGLTLFLQEIT